MNKNNIQQIEEKLKKKTPMIALVAPSFLTDFEYPSIVYQLKKLGFDKVVELTFGAKMVNREYHKLLKKSKKLVIASPCPGVVSTLQNNFPKLKNQIALVDSPLIAMAKICKKQYPKHHVVFISPCDFKKIESENSKYIDGVIDYEQLKETIEDYRTLVVKYKESEALRDK